MDELLAELDRRGVVLEVRGGELHFRAPKGALTDELKAALRGAKADVVERLRGRRDDTGLVAVPRGGVLPLSFQQERFLLLERLEPGCGAYLVPIAARLRGGVDEDGLRAAVADLVRRHEVLRCVASGGGQVPLDEDAFSFETGELTDGAIAAELARPVDLERGPLLRVRLWRVAADEHVLFVVTHLFCGDGWSVEHLLEQLAALYRAHAAGRRPALPEQPLQYADFAAWQRRSAAGDFDDQIAFWERTLADAPPRLRIPTDRRRSFRATSRSRRHAFALSGEASRCVRETAARCAATPFAVLVAGLDVFLARLCDTDDVVLATITSNRGRIETERMLGSFSNAVFLRARVDLAAPFDDAVRAAQRRLLEAGVNQDVPTELLAERFELSGARLPELQVLVIYHEREPVDLLDLGDVGVERIPVDPGGTRVDWNLALAADGDGFGGELDLPENLYDDESAAVLVADYEALLVAGSAGASLAAVPLAYTGSWQPPSAAAPAAPALGEELTSTEHSVRAAWLAHLEVESVGRHDNFFDLGGHSLAAIEVIARLENELGVRLDVGDFMMQTLAQVAATCDSRRPTSPPTDRPGIFSRMFRRRPSR